MRIATDVRSWLVLVLFVMTWTFGYAFGRQRGWANNPAPGTTASERRTAAAARSVLERGER